jgi:hypothetical protein
MQVNVMLNLSPEAHRELVRMRNQRGMSMNALCTDLVIVGLVNLRQVEEPVENHIHRGASSLDSEHSIVRPTRRGAR